MSFPACSIGAAPLCTILPSYWGSKNPSSFGFHREVAGTGVTGEIAEEFAGGFASTLDITAAAICAIAA